MDFNFTPQEDAFREKVRTFLKTNLPEGWGSTEFELPEELQGKQFYVQWHRKLYQHGLVGHVMAQAVRRPGRDPGRAGDPQRGTGAFSRSRSVGRESD